MLDRKLYIDLHFEGGRYQIKLNAFTFSATRTLERTQLVDINHRHCQSKQLNVRVWGAGEEGAQSRR